MIEQLSAFVTRASYEDLSAEARRQIKVSVLDSLACAIGAIGYEPMRRLRTPDRAIWRKAARHNDRRRKDLSRSSGVLQRRAHAAFGLQRRFLSREGSCQPSDCLPAILAASEYAGASGREFLTALAVAYQVQCRLCEVLFARAEGLRHGTPGSYAVAAGVAKALKLDQEQTAKAISSVALATPRHGSPGEGAVSLCHRTSTLIRRPQYLRRSCLQ